MDADFGHVVFSATELSQVREKRTWTGFKYRERENAEGIYQLFVHDLNKVSGEFCFPIGEGVD